MEKDTVSRCCDGHPDAQDCNGLVTDLSLGTYSIKVVQIVDRGCACDNRRLILGGQKELKFNWTY